ncbi:MAG: hypothetical protein ABI528_04050 [bacterium]
MTKDDLNGNSNIKYDHRNLITELRQKVGSKFKHTFYKYDESGNRISKTVYEYQGSSITQDTTDESDFPNNSDWQLFNKEIYSRDVSGRELAIYVNDEISEYPIYGLSLIGKIKNNVTYYYYKDHLGSVRAVVNSSNSLISAQDYDAWGYLLDGRSYQSDESKFKFTGKEKQPVLKLNYRRLLPKALVKCKFVETLINLFHNQKHPQT